MAAASRKKVRTTDRDLDMFLFLWEWKLATTKAISDRFFPNLNPVAAYNRLTDLKNAGFVKLQTLNGEGTHFVWCLTPKSFRILKTHLPELKDDGFRSESLEHDFYVTAVHLGEWVTNPPEKSSLFTEQQLRRYHLDHYPSWVPKASFRRPDGYWLVEYRGQMVPIALEVELSTKAIEDYRVIAQFYKDHPKIFRVVWIVRTAATAVYIQDKFKSEVADKEALIHDFVLLGDIEKLLWHAPVFLGHEQGRTLGFVLGSHSNRTEPDPLRCPWGIKGASLLDARKFPVASKTSRPSQKNEFINRMAYRPSEPSLSTTVHNNISIHLSHQPSATPSTNSNP